MAELKRVGTQQEALKKAVAEAMADAQASGQSFSVSPLKGLRGPEKQDKGVGPDAAPGTPGIQAKWTDSPSTSRQGSQVAAIAPSDSAALQMSKAAEVDNMAESLKGKFRRDEIRAPPEQIPPPQAAPLPAAAPLPPVPKKRSTLPPEVIAESGVRESRDALARMQVALGGHDDSGQAAFDPSQYIFDKVPSRGDNRSMLQRRHDHDNLEVQRRENERLKKREKQWKEDQKHLAQQQAEVEASAANNQLLQAHLGPTPSRPGTDLTRTCLWAPHLAPHLAK
ncbi:hypothetical protein ABBQ38_014653 [Trebouxia sp. C0009 RCD-2024]